MDDKLSIYMYVCIYINFIWKAKWKIKKSKKIPKYKEYWNANQHTESS